MFDGLDAIPYIHHCSMLHYSHPHFKENNLSSKLIQTYHRSTAHLIWHRRLQTSNTGTQWHGQWLLCKVLPKKDEKKARLFVRS